MKLNQQRFNIIKKHLAKQNSKTLKQTAKKYNLSERTVRYISDSDHYASYKINIRQYSEPKDWLIERGYEDMSLLKSYVRRLKKAF